MDRTPQVVWPPSNDPFLQVWRENLLCSPIKFSRSCDPTTWDYEPDCVADAPDLTVDPESKALSWVEEGE